MSSSKNGARARNADPIDLLRDDITAIKHDLTALIGGRFGALSEGAKEKLSQAGESARELAGQAREKAGELHEGLREAAAARPITTIALSVAAGAIAVKLLGWMLRR